MCIKLETATTFQNPSVDEVYVRHSHIKDKVPIPLSCHLQSLYKHLIVESKKCTCRPLYVWYLVTCCWPNYLVVGRPQQVVADLPLGMPLLVVLLDIPLLVVLLGNLPLVVPLGILPLVVLLGIPLLEVVDHPQDNPLVAAPLQDIPLLVAHLGIPPDTLPEGVELHILLDHWKIK